MENPLTTNPKSPLNQILLKKTFNKNSQISILNQGVTSGEKRKKKQINNKKTSLPVASKVQAAKNKI